MVDEEGGVEEEEESVAEAERRKEVRDGGAAKEKPAAKKPDYEDLEVIALDEAPVYRALVCNAPVYRKQKRRSVR